jgi:endonuclease/exonuclease/phosphatase family metal-dependent hydrolase
MTIALRDFVLLALMVLLCVAAPPVNAQGPQRSNSLTVLNWNIWHGGKEDGDKLGPQRVIDVIRDSKADVVAMQETYGSGERISKALGFKFHPRGTNVSIHSRYPVIEDISIFEEFKCVGALIELPGKRKIAFYSIWLPYNKEIWAVGTRDSSKPDEMLAACQASCDDLEKIKVEIEIRLADRKYADVPVIIAGDFNSMSHLDYIESFKEQNEVAIDWPTSSVLVDDGFRDSWRELHPEVNRLADRTWTPRFPDQQQDRIDFIYYRGKGLVARESRVVDSHEVKFPSDHAALVTRFDLTPIDDQGKLRVASYNIRHGQGTDNRLDLDRTAALLANLKPDVIGLQEVDNRVNRSKNVDQATFLASRLGMNHAFGSFMDYQGGKYGLAILSRYPIVNQHEIRLPDGNEPRVALACEIQLPGEKFQTRSVMAVNLHFDWVKDDSFRFAQAEKLLEFLAELEMPYLLIGDFNDTIESRTLKLLARNALEADKPESDQKTFSSTEPRTEIDFIFASPKSSWQLQHCRIFDAPLTSDHRPVVAEFLLKEK